MTVNVHRKRWKEPVNLCSPRTDDVRDAKRGKKKGIPPKVKAYYLMSSHLGRRDRLHSLHVAESGFQSAKHVDDLNGSTH